MQHIQSQDTDRFTALPDATRRSRIPSPRSKRACRHPDGRRPQRGPRGRPRPHPPRLLGNYELLGDTRGDRHRRSDQRRRLALRLGPQGPDARPRDPDAGDQGDHAPARLRPRQHPRRHPRRKRPSSPPHWAANSPRIPGAPRTSSSSSGRRSSCPTSPRRTTGSTSIPPAPEPASARGSTGVAEAFAGTLDIYNIMSPAAPTSS